MRQRIFRILWPHGVGVLLLLVVLGIGFMWLNSPIQTSPASEPPPDSEVAVEVEIRTEESIQGQEQTQKRKFFINPLPLVGVLFLFIIVSIMIVAVKLRAKYMILVARGSVLYVENRFRGTGRWAKPGTQFVIPIVETWEIFPGADVEILIPEQSVDYKTPEGLVQGTIDVRAVVRIFNVAHLVGKLSSDVEESGGERIPWRRFVRTAIRAIVYGQTREYSFTEVGSVEDASKAFIATELNPYGIALISFHLENADVDPRYQQALQEQAIAELTANADRRFMDETGMSPEQYALVVAAKDGSIVGALMISALRAFTQNQTSPVPVQCQNIPQPASEVIEEE